MFGLFDSDGVLERYQKRAHEAAIDRRIGLCVPWTPETKWARELNIAASSYTPPLLFPDLAPVKPDTPNHQDAVGIVSPGGQWLYLNKVLPGGTILETAQGRRVGTVMFDSDVIIPCVHDRERRSAQPLWRHRPYMSLTPMEILSLRPGTKKAKGNVIVAGLGLGHQLIEVSKRRQIKELTLVEQSQDLVDWLWPHIEPQLGCKVNVVIGDAQKLLPTMHADVALVDIFPDFGGNRLYNETPNIPTVWCWGGG
jgi:hypothetical protein